MAASLKPSGPVLLAGFALVGAYLWARRGQAQQKVTGVVSQKTVDYATPSLIAQTLGAFVARYTQGASATSKDVPYTSPADKAPSAADPLAGVGGFGWNVGDASSIASLSSPGSGWTLPAPSAVANRSVSGLGGYIDSVFAAPVYDISSDFKNNPTWELMAP